jgi:DNA modification methylase
MNSFKSIEIEIDRPLKEKGIAILNELSNKSSKDDISFDYGRNKIFVQLRSLDMIGFRGIINELEAKHKIGKEDNPLPEIIKKIEDIKSYGLKGKKRIFVDYNKERKVKNRNEKVKKRGAYYYAQDNNFVAINNGLPKEYQNKIICGDSGNILKQLPNNCIDLVITSPPYNFGLDYDGSNDDSHWQKYFDKLFAVFDECIRVLKYGGRIIINVQPLFSDYIPSHHIISKYFMDRKLIWKGEILWEKNNYNCKYTAWGSWKSPSNPYLKYTWEFIEIFAKGTMKKEGKRDDIDISADEFKKWVVAKWSMAPERNMKAYNHPAMFPEELVYRAIRLFSYKNDIVLDPFNGVGTTTAVAKKLNRRYLGIDISKDYCKKAVRRIPDTLF